MLMESTPVPAEIHLLLYSKVLLVPKEDDSTACNQTSKVILLVIGKCGEVETFDFRADCGKKVLNSDTVREKP